MAGLELFQRMSLDQVAKWLELHPFEVVRILVADGTLPPDLRLDSADVERVRARGQLETWWEKPPTAEEGESPDRALVRALLRELVSRGLVEPQAARADNLFRGLDADQQRLLRRAVNALIKEGCLYSQMSALGLSVGVRLAAADSVRQFAESGGGPVERLWDQD